MVSIKKLKKVAKKEINEDISLKWEKYTAYSALLVADVINEDVYFLISKPKLV